MNVFNPRSRVYIQLAPTLAKKIFYSGKISLVNINALMKFGPSGYVSGACVGRPQTGCQPAARFLKKGDLPGKSLKIRTSCLPNIELAAYIYAYD